MRQNTGPARLTIWLATRVVSSSVATGKPVGYRNLGASVMHCAVHRATGEGQGPTFAIFCGCSHMTAGRALPAVSPD